SCLPSYIGSPPGCRPECVSNAECPSLQACINQKCNDPCLGICGSAAECRVINHSPICSCPPNHMGDPFFRCIPNPPAAIYPEPSIPQQPINPCAPSPCGPNSQCQSYGGTPQCTCHPGYSGSPPNCRPECIINSDCPSN